MKYGGVDNVAPASIWVILAALNEGQAIGEIVARLREMSLTVVVVDDGSKDDTFLVARTAGAYTLRHSVNLGQGAALQTGVEYAVAQGATYVVTFDADGQHSAEEILPMVEALRASHADIALGSRFIGNAIGISWLRIITLKAAVLFTFATTGLKLSDAHNGFRALTQSCAKKLELNQNRMAHASEIISFVAENKLEFIEFPVTVTYTDYSRRKGQRVSGAIKILSELFVGRISR